MVTEKDKIRYDKLLLSVGGEPFIPPIKGIQKRGVFTFAGWDDVKAIGDFLRENDAKRSVIVGGGMIGIKSADALRECGLNVTIVELMERILPMALDDEGGRICEEHLIENGIDIITGDGIEEILGEDEVSGVRLKSGKRIECRIVIVAIGVHPNIELAESAGLKVDRGIKVDRVMQTSKKDIYAAGDCVESYNILLEQEMPIPILPLAYKGGFTAGVNMAGGKGRSEYHGGFPMNSIQAFGLPLISLGMVNPDGGCEVLSTREGKNYKRLVLKNGKIFGYLAIGNIDRAGIVAGMMKEGMNVEKFKEAIMEDDFGLIYLPKDIRDNKLRG
ncbi:MAG: NAD(P)/FAD-dependent oxidoreductase [Candidatus Methanolliviera sp. GoM_asphalt]|nr:MAG: NAD(P)/FAD-dependent oxidoreductase [Candidatus Methanolliviera sp. GoM_asphalt]